MNRIALIVLTIFFLLAGCTPKEVKEHQAEITIERATKNNEFLMNGSPLTEEDLKSFSGLKYFPIDYEYRVSGFISPFPNAQRVILEQGDTTKEMIRYGKVAFDLQEESFELTVYKPLIDELSTEEDYLFIPFFDKTNSELTYDGGRYLYPEYQGDGTAIVDFNLASNPYCAYNHKYNCVVPPAENTLPLEIKAGEKSYH